MFSDGMTNGEAPFKEGKSESLGFVDTKFAGVVHVTSDGAVDRAMFGEEETDTRPPERDT
jgi:hypothetical protein